MGADRPDPVRALRAELGGVKPPKGVDQLDDDEVEHLAAALRAAHERQAHALADALDGSLRLVPGLLRGPVKKILLG